MHCWFLLNKTVIRGYIALNPQEPYRESEILKKFNIFILFSGMGRHTFLSRIFSNLLDALKAPLETQEQTGIECISDEFIHVALNLYTHRSSKFVIKKNNWDRWRNLLKIQSFINSGITHLWFDIICSEESVLKPVYIPERTNCK